jgi:hypothetical protein
MPTARNRDFHRRRGALSDCFFAQHHSGRHLAAPRVETAARPSTDLPPTTTTHSPTTPPKPIGCAPPPARQGPPARTQSAHDRKD